MDGLETLAELKRLRPGAPPWSMISGHGTIETAVKATRLGAYDFIEKPLSLEKTLLDGEPRARARAGSSARTAHLRPSSTRGQEIDRRERRDARSCASRSRSAAPANGRVLIHGENGSGKELVARAIHALSARREAPFVEVNCAAIPEELIESELFGHERGAFTGAMARRQGKFELADGGTLFLDEIGDMSLKTQAKVLRVLQEQAVRAGGRPGDASRSTCASSPPPTRTCPSAIAQGALPRGSLLPPQRHPDRGAAAARAQGGRAAAGRALHPRLLRGERQAARRPWRRRP